MKLVLKGIQTRLAFLGYLLLIFNQVYGDEVLEPGKNPAQESDCTCVPYYLCEADKIITDEAGLINVGTKEGPCKSYLEICCEKPLSEPEKITPVPRARDGCGRLNPAGVSFRITENDEEETQFGEFPWMVTLFKQEEGNGEIENLYVCGGALIHPQVVLTAAHCVRENLNYRIRAGEWDTQTNNELLPHQDAGVKNVVVHPDFDSRELFNDVALLFLDSVITLADNIDVVCLPKQGSNFDGSRCFASGWGTDAFGIEGKYQLILKKVNLPMVPHKQCEDLLRKTRLSALFNLHESFVCAGGEPNKDTCKGDGGGPLVCPVPGTINKYVQVGIVSWGIGCGKPNTPGLYANVAKFRNWIDQELACKGLNTSYYDY